MPTTYRIVRHFKNEEFGKAIIKRGLTLEEAEHHCSDPETSSSTAKGPAQVARTERLGEWHEEYAEED